MKNILLSFTIFSIFLSIGTAQSMNHFFKYEGVQLLAEIAHPFSNFETGRYDVYTNEVRISMKYTEGSTNIILYRKGNFFTDIKVSSDSFFWAAFSVAQNIKNFVLEILEEDSETDTDKTINEFEIYLGKQIHEMSGKDLALILINLAWWSYD